jgi:hypothetical protein
MKFIYRDPGRTMGERKQRTAAEFMADPQQQVSIKVLIHFLTFSIKIIANLSKIVEQYVVVLITSKVSAEDA